jgi:acyl-coenzyme A synthetase/AMP-(fatty) acid ligase
VVAARRLTAAATTAMVADPILDAFARQAALHRGRTLLFSADFQATVGDIEALAAAALAAARVHRAPPHTVVGLAALPGPAWIAGFLALRRLACVPLLLDGTAPAAENSRIAASLGATAIFSTSSGWPEQGDWTWTERAVNGGPPAVELPGIAVVKLTSGTTGAPRGIATPSAALVADDAALRRTMGLTDEDRLLAGVPLAHSYGLSSLLLPALIAGIPLVFPDDGLYGPFAAAARFGATVFPTTPAYLDALVRTAEPPPTPPSLRLVLAAGAPLTPQTATRFRTACGLPVHVFYGASECGGICYDREGDAAERGTVGTPVEGVEVTLGDRADQESGLVMVRSAAVADRYLPHPEERLLDGRFLTQDLATFRNGELVLTGRQDAVINIKGKKVDPYEVEAVLALLAGVEEVAVIGVRVPERTSEVLRAVIACEPGSLTTSEVLAWCRAHLAAHKVPRSLILVDRMPRTNRGKLDRSALLALRPGAETGLPG